MMCQLQGNNGSGEASYGALQGFGCCIKNIGKSDIR